MARAVQVPVSPCSADRRGPRASKGGGQQRHGGHTAGKLVPAGEKEEDRKPVLRTLVACMRASWRRQPSPGPWRQGECETPTGRG